MGVRDGLSKLNRRRIHTRKGTTIRYLSERSTHCRGIALRRLMRGGCFKLAKQRKRIHHTCNFLPHFICRSLNPPLFLAVGPRQSGFAPSKLRVSFPPRERPLDRAVSSLPLLYSGGVSLKLIYLETLQGRRGRMLEWPREREGMKRPHLPLGLFDTPLQGPEMRLSA